MTAADLHTALEAAITARLEVARAAKVDGDGTWHLGTRGGWLIEDDAGEPVVHDEGSPTEEQAAHIALHDPADAVRRYERDRATLLRHSPVAVHTNIDPRMVACAYEFADGDGYVVPWEFCPHVKDLLYVYPEVTRP